MPELLDAQGFAEIRLLSAAPAGAQIPPGLRREAELPPTSTGPLARQKRQQETENERDGAATTRYPANESSHELQQLKAAVILCAAGDIHGALDRMYAGVLAFEVALGVRFDWLLHVGDFGVWPDPARVDGATKRHDGAGDFRAWIAERRAAPRRTVFIKGNHEDFVWLDAQPSAEVLPGLRNGHVHELVAGDEVLRVGGVGGCFGPSNFERRSSTLQGYAKRHYTRDEIATLSARADAAHALSESLFEVGDARILARLGFLPAGATVDPAAIEPAKEKSWLLDLDMFSATATPFVVNQVVEQALRYAERIYTIFRWAVTDEFLVRYGGKP